MNKRRVLPPKERLLELFSYEENTGNLRWKPRPRSEFTKDWVCRSWNTKYAGRITGCFVPKEGFRITLGKTGYAAHRIIYKMITGLEPSHIDHKDLNRANNRFSNLRPANDMSNGWNTAGHKNTISGLKGVYYHWRCTIKPWQATARKAGKAYSGGYYPTKEEAFIVACKLREQLHGEFARHGINT